MIDVLYVHFFFFFNDTATTEIYTLSLHDALPISSWLRAARCRRPGGRAMRRSIHRCSCIRIQRRFPRKRSEEHTSELQSRLHLVCRLLLEKKKKHPADTSTADTTTWSVYNVPNNR